LEALPLSEGTISCILENRTDYSYIIYQEVSMQFSDDPVIDEDDEE
jgi:hypothetical protein